MTTILIKGAGQEFAVEYGRVLLHRYRGATARMMWVEGTNKYTSIARYNELKSLIVASKASGGFDIEIDAVADPGVPTEFEKVVMKRLIPHRLFRVGRQRWRLEFYDRRARLYTAVSSTDMRMTFGDGYLTGTDFQTYRQAIEAAVANQSTLAADFSPEAVQLLSASTEFTKDDYWLAGMDLPKALDYIADEANGDVDVTLDGLIRFTNRADIGEASTINVDDYPWEDEPAWDPADVVHGLEPKIIRNYYTERHQVSAQFRDARQTFVRTEPAELRASLIPVYLWSLTGTHLELPDILEAAGYPRFAISEADIARKWAANMQGTAIAADGSFKNGELLKAIHTCWRRRYKVSFPSGHLGGWTDWAFGVLTPEGIVEESAVDCKAVEFKWLIEFQQGQDVAGTTVAFNRDAPSRMTARWGMESESLILSLENPEDADPGSVWIPGELAGELKIQRVGNGLEDGTGQRFLLPGSTLYELLEVPDASMARFLESLTLSVNMVGTRRAPNNSTRWWPVDIDGFPDGDVEVQELPPPENLFAYRGLVDPTNPQPDGLGPVLNPGQLQADAERRAEVWKVSTFGGVEGSGVAIGVSAFRDIDIQGSVRETMLEISGSTVRTHVHVGNLSNLQAREARASKRVQQRRQEERGKVVV